jgi:hypothetical protein
MSTEAPPLMSMRVIPSTSTGPSKVKSRCPSPLGPKSASSSGVSKMPAVVCVGNAVFWRIRMLPRSTRRSGSPPAAFGPAGAESKIVGPRWVTPVSDELIVTPPNSVPVSAVPFAGPEKSIVTAAAPPAANKAMERAETASRTDCRADERIEPKPISPTSR